MSEWLSVLLLYFIGAVVGCINILAGGGSLISVPVLIFLGLDPMVANATNRVSIAMQCISGTAGFRDKGVDVVRFSIPLAVSALLGSVVGSYSVLQIPSDWFKTIFALIMFGVVAVMVFDPFKRSPRKTESAAVSRRQHIVTTILFFFVGVYGGFIQAGVGFVSLSVLMLVAKFDLVKSNAVKVLVAVFYSLTSVIIFTFSGKIMWLFGIALGLGSSSGAWFMSRYSVDKGHDWIKKIVIAAIVVMAIRLLFS